MSSPASVIQQKKAAKPFKRGIDQFNEMQAKLNNTTVKDNDDGATPEQVVVRTGPKETPAQYRARKARRAEKEKAYLEREAARADARAKYNAEKKAAYEERCRKRAEQQAKAKAWWEKGCRERNACFNCGAEDSHNAKYCPEPTFKGLY